MSFYEPGKPYGNTTKGFLANTPTNTLGYPPPKRTLSAEEFEYYHAKLDDESLPEPVRAGVAVVLYADLKRWFGLHAFTSDITDEYLSPQVKNLSEIYYAYDEGSSEKNQGRAEIKKFDLYLTETTPPGIGTQHAAIQDARKNFAVRLAIAKKEKEKQMSVEELLAQERQAVEDKEVLEEAKMQGLVIAQAIESHMVAKIREYLAATFDASMAKFFMDDTNSQREFKLRMDLIKQVNNKKLNPVEAIARYQKILDNFTGLKKDIPIGIFSHPILDKLNTGGSGVN